MTLLALVLGAAWRRWYGSARPGWAFPGYRGLQVLAGFSVLGLLQIPTGDYLWRCALDSALAIGFMTLPIRYSRRPFEFISEWLVARGLPTTARLPHPWKTMLQGPAPISEALQGGLLWFVAVLV